MLFVSAHGSSGLCHSERAPPVCDSGSGKPWEINASAGYPDLTKAFLPWCASSGRRAPATALLRQSLRFRASRAPKTLEGCVSVASAFLPLGIRHPTVRALIEPFRSGSRRFGLVSRARGDPSGPPPSRSALSFVECRAILQKFCSYPGLCKESRPCVAACECSLQHMHYA